MVRLIRQMSWTNPRWGEPRIYGELLKLGIGVAQRTVTKCVLPGSSRPSSQTWTMFLRNHLGRMMSVDFFTVPTVDFRLLDVLLVLSHQRSKVLHFGKAERFRAARMPGSCDRLFPQVGGLHHGNERRAA